jgi:hypothetical protein
LKTQKHKNNYNTLKYLIDEMTDENYNTDDDIDNSDE